VTALNVSAAYLALFTKNPSILAPAVRASSGTISAVSYRGWNGNAKPRMSRRMLRTSEKTVPRNAMTRSPPLSAKPSETARCRQTSPNSNTTAPLPPAPSPRGMLAFAAAPSSSPLPRGASVLSLRPRVTASSTSALLVLGEKAAAGTATSRMRPSPSVGVIGRPNMADVGSCWKRAISRVRNAVQCGSPANRASAAAHSPGLAVRWNAATSRMRLARTATAAPAPSSTGFTAAAAPSSSPATAATTTGPALRLTLPPSPASSRRASVTVLVTSRAESSHIWSSTPVMASTASCTSSFSE